LGRGRRVEREFEPIDATECARHEPIGRHIIIKSTTAHPKPVRQSLSV
jgi:hypothetical protein